jgi:hypothetical protein
MEASCKKECLMSLWLEVWVHEYASHIQRLVVLAKTYHYSILEGGFLCSARNSACLVSCWCKLKRHPNEPEVVIHL